MMADNVAFADGSVRTTRVVKLVAFDSDTLRGMNYTRSFPWTWFLRRGETWQTDCYPTAGAAINKYDKSNRQVTPSISDQRLEGWPFDGCRENRTP